MKIYEEVKVASLLCSLPNLKDELIINNSLDLSMESGLSTLKI